MIESMDIFNDDSSAVNKKYQDSVFRDLFSEPEYSVELVNALCDTNYKEGDLIDVSLKWVFTNGRYNDLAFRTNDDRLIVLIEHQSTFNPNMPLRILLYLAKEYEDYLSTKYDKGKDCLYGKRLIKLPTPEFFIIYTGDDERPGVEELRLSDAFFGKPGVELVVKSYNINKPLTLKDKSHTLDGYSNLVSKVKEFKGNGLNITEAVRKAIDYCIDNQYIQKYLGKKKKEVYDMLYNEVSFEREVEIRCLEEREDGIAVGREEGREEVVLNMYNKGLDLNTISEFSGIPLDRVKDICGFNE